MNNFTMVEVQSSNKARCLIARLYRISHKQTFLNWKNDKSKVLIIITVYVRNVLNQKKSFLSSCFGFGYSASPLSEKAAMVGCGGFSRELVLACC